MKVASVAAALALRSLTGDLGFDKEVTGGYVGDLLSRVMARAQAGNIWVTTQAHANVVAVACLVGLSAVILAEGVTLDPALAKKAREEGLPVFSSVAPAYAVVAGLARMGVQAGA